MHDNVCPKAPQNCPPRAALQRRVARLITIASLTRPSAARRAEKTRIARRVRRNGGRRNRFISSSGQRCAMGKPFKGVVNLDIAESGPDRPYAQPIAPEDAPNVLYAIMVLDRSKWRWR